MSNNKKKKIIVVVIFTVFVLNIVGIFPISINNNVSPQKRENISSAATTYQKYYTDQQWLTNNGFESGTTNWTDTTTESNGDLDSYSSSGVAGFDVLGDQGDYIYNEIPTYTDWGDPISNPNTEFTPDYYGYSNGVYIDDDWDDYSPQDQHTGYLWKMETSTDINISDYEIVSASLSAHISAQEHTGGSYANEQYDRGIMYVMLSDPSETYLYTVAKYTVYENSISNQAMTVVADSVLITILDTVLKEDYQNFIIFLGIEAEFVDDQGVDYDGWNYLTINDIDLEFTYNKIIDYNSEVSWNQTGNAISSDAVITEATASFDYWKSGTWSGEAPESEIAIVLNDADLKDTVKLSDIGDSPQTKVIDVTSKILTGVNVDFTIKLIIKDNFDYDTTMRFSIDNIYLNITYYEYLNATETSIDLFLNGENRTIEEEIEIYLGNSINVTAIFEDDNGDFIPNATLEFSGGGILDNMTKHGTLNQYYINIDTEMIGTGDTYCKITASKYTYETQVKTFKISVLDRYAYIDKIYLNNTDKTSSKSIENLPSGDPLYINVTYIDNLTSSSIENATVQLYDGITLVGNFTYNSLSQYNYTYNTTGIPKSVKYLTVRAQKDDYTLDYVQLVVVIDAKGASLTVYMNYTESDEISTTINDFVILNVTYKDSDGYPISSAEVSVNGSGVSAILEPYVSNNNYSLIIDTNDLIGSINRLDIYAEADGFVAVPATIIIQIGERNTSISVFLNSTTETPISESFSVDYEIEIGEKLNITVKYSDYSSGELIVPANMNLSIPNLGYYDYLVNVSDNYYILIFDTLVTGVKYGSTYDLIVKASRINYVSQSFTIHLDIKPRPTDYELFLNGDEYIVNETAEISLPYSALCNITIRYLNNDTKVYINGTTELSYVFNSIDYVYFLNNTIPNYQFYLMNTSSLAPGTTRITLSSSYGNFQPYDVSIRLVIQPIQVEIISLEGDSIELLTGQAIIIRVYINNTDFNTPITGINVDYSSPFGTGTLTETGVSGIYEVNLGTAQQGLYQIVITVFLGENYAYSSKTIYISMKISPNDAFLITVIQILATVGIISVIGFSTYIYLYQKILKFPKQVRKVRKFKRSLRKKGAVSIDIISREKGFSEAYTEKLGIISKSLKGKAPITQTEQGLLPIK